MQTKEKEPSFMSNNSSSNFDFPELFARKKQNETTNSFEKKLHQYVLAKKLQLREPPEKDANQNISQQNNDTNVNVSDKATRNLHNLHINTHPQSFAQSQILFKEQEQQVPHNQHLFQSQLLQPQSQQQEQQTTPYSQYFSQSNFLSKQNYIEYDKGPRVGKDGKLISYSIVGKPQWYLKYKDMQNKKKYNPLQMQRESQMQQDEIDEEEEGNDQEKESNLQQKQSYQQKIQSSAFANSQIRYQQSLEKKSPKHHKDVPIHLHDPKLASKAEGSSNNASKLMGKTMNPKKKIKKNDFIVVPKEELLEEMKQIQTKNIFFSQKEKTFIENLPIDQKNAFTRDQRIIDKYERQTQLWNSDIANLSRLSKRRPEESLLQTGDDFRRKLELDQANYHLKSEQEKFGKRIWYMQLRQADFRNLNKGSQNQLSLPTLKSQKHISLPSHGDINQQQGPNWQEFINVDVVYGKNTQYYYNPDKQIEVIRKPQNATKPNIMSLSASMKSRQYHSITQQKILEYLQQNQPKLKNSMILCEDEMDDLVVVGKNKFQSELQVIQSELNNKNVVFQRLKKEEDEEKKAADDPKNKDKFNNNPNKQEQDTKPIKPVLSPDVIPMVFDENYNITELSKTGNLYYPKLLSTLSSTFTSDFGQN